MASRHTEILLVGLSWLLALASAEPSVVDTASLKHIANVSFAAENANPGGIASIFSPRMDFDQWKPLTGRGDPLRNDPTYDYEPPMLEHVHYWADDTRLEREHYPERKSEVLVLGVSSRKPSVGPRHPSPPRRHHRPPPTKYEDYSYRLSDNFPMTILVPPPPPPPGHKPLLFILNEKHVSPASHIKVTNPPKFVKETTSSPEHLTSLYALQESNLIYQSSTTSQNWILDANKTQGLPNSEVTSDYAGWGPTTPLDEIEAANDTHNLIFNDHDDVSKQPYSFYKPMLSEAPPPPRVTSNPLLLPTFVPTALPPLRSTDVQSIVTEPQPTWLTESTTTEASTYTIDYNEETTTDKINLSGYQTTPTGFTSLQPNTSILDMLSPMITMPLVNGPDRPEDNLYAHASENLHVYKEHQTEDSKELEIMQTMQPPQVQHAETTPTAHKQPFHVNTHVPNAFLHKKPTMYTHDPYLNMRYTSPMSTVASTVQFEKIKSTTAAPTVPMYLIIQGHSKVKSYGAKPKLVDENDTINNEISKPNETNEVKHLHPIKEKYSSLKTEKGEIRKSRVQNLKSLIDEGRGSIEIQETDLGIKYDVSDGSDVPVEIYRKGIVDNDENNYSNSKTKNENSAKKIVKRQLPVSIDEIMPFDEDKLERYVYNYLKKQQNSTGLTGLLSKVVTGGVSSLIGDIAEEEEDDDDDDDDDEDDERR